MNHSLTKPLSGGSAEMAMAPMRKASAVQGISLARPPILSMSRVWRRNITDPVPMNSRLLKMAWLSR
ncbi:hypothetical protein D3C86_1687120 [compost metagenome]